MSSWFPFAIGLGSIIAATMALVIAGGAFVVPGGAYAYVTVVALLAAIALALVAWGCLRTRR